VISNWQSRKLKRIFDWVDSYDSILKITKRAGVNRSDE